MTILKHIPNALTCGNLAAGCLGVVWAAQGQMTAAAVCIMIACVFDFFDGFAARLLKVSSPIGKELDSLADMVSFGALPGLIMFQYINALYLYHHDLTTSAFLFSSQDWEMSAIIPGYSSDSFRYVGSYPWYSYLAFSITIFSALRLAKFNVDTRQSESFIGLPTPANALFISSLAFVNRDFLVELNYLFSWNLALGILLGITALFSFLLVAPLPLFALKFKHFAWKGNEMRYIFLILSVLTLVFLKFSGIPIIIILYLILSLIAIPKRHEV